MGKPDISSKKIINLYNEAWVKWVLRQTNIEVEAELSGEFQFVARSTDSLLKVKQADNSHFLVLTEMQFVYNKKMAKRLAAYKLLAEQKYKLDVYAIVLYFLPPPKDIAIPTSYHREFMAQTTHLDFRVIKLWELEAEQVLNFDNPALLPFVPLMKGGNTIEIVEQCAKRIRQKTENPELETILAAFASYVINEEIITQILRWDMQIVKESPIMKELFKEERKTWFEKGRKEGREEGERNAKIEMLNKMVALRFQVEVGKFEEELAKLDIKTITELAEISFTVENLTEFEQALKQAIEQSQLKEKANDKKANDEKADE